MRNGSEGFLPTVEAQTPTWVASGTVERGCLSHEPELQDSSVGLLLKRTSSLISWRRQWHPTPVLLPGKSHERRSLVGCSPWGRKESDVTERLHFHFTFMHWRRKWQPTPVFLPGESQGRGSLMGCHLWGRTESDMTEAT